MTSKSGRIVNRHFRIGKEIDITLLKNLDRDTEVKLGDIGIVTLKQLLGKSPEELASNAKIKKDKVFDLVKSAKKLLA